MALNMCSATSSESDSEYSGLVSGHVHKTGGHEAYCCQEHKAVLVYYHVFITESDSIDNHSSGVRTLL